MYYNIPIENILVLNGDCFPVCSANSILGLHGERGDGSIILTPVDQSSYRESGMIYLADIIMASL